jgi:hypothetical protein
MKCAWVSVTILGCLLAFASAIPLSDSAYGGPEYLEMEKNLLVLLKYIHQPYSNAELYSFGTHYVISEDYENYNNVDKVKEFVKFYEKKRLLPVGENFSLYNPEHLEQVKALFEVFYNAKNYETLAKVTAWARFNISESLLMYVIGLTVSHRQDIKTLIMPPPYEVCPYQFVNAEVIKSAQRMKMQGFPGVEKVNGLKEVIIPMNYTGWYLHMNKDQKVTYFTEDVGLNAFYYNFHLDYPYWMEGKPYGLDKDRRGEFYITFHQQLIARYYLERLSNNLGHIPGFHWRQPIKAGYYPGLMYDNGQQFKMRPNFFNLYNEGNHKFIQEAEDRERRIRDVVDLGYIFFDDKNVTLTEPEDVNTLGNLLQGNPDAMEHHHNYHDHIVPSYLENYATAARDPLFYSFYKKLLHNYWIFMSHIKPYTYEEVAFPGVKIVTAEVDKIETYFEHLDVDITNAIDIDQEPVEKLEKIVKEIHFKPDEYMIKARTVRLNYKPFNMKLVVQSDKSYSASVRVMIGPKYDEYGSEMHFEENRKNFVILDIFKQKLVPGENIIKRSSDQIWFYGPAQTSYYELYQNVMSAKSGATTWTPDLYKGRCQFPKHIMIPKGQVDGMPFKMFFIISEFKPASMTRADEFNRKHECGVGTGARYFEERTLLFPIDRHIDSKHFFVPNIHFADVEIHFNPDASEGRYY